MSAASTASRRAYRVRILVLVAGILISADGAWGAVSTQNVLDEALCAPAIRKDQTDGVIEGVIGMKNTMGYAGLDSIVLKQKSQAADGACGLKLAKMRNKDGAIVEANSDTAQAAVRSNSNTLKNSSTCAGFGLCGDIFDASAADVWPMATLTYFVIGLNNTDSENNCGRVKATYDYTKWILTNAKAAEIAKSLQFAAMPNTVSQAAIEIMDQMSCTKDGNTTLVKNWPSAATSISGSGSSLQGGLQTKLTNEYNIQTSVTVTYTSTSSGTGRNMFNANSVDFAGSDSLIKMTGSTEKLRKQRMIPVFAAAVGIMYNNKNVDNLILSREAVNGIFTGTISGWADAAIKATNPGVDWPNDAIIRIVRKDDSGTTGALTQALASFASLPKNDHALKGSQTPTWPNYALPFSGGVSCVYKNCTNAICLPGFYLVEADDKCEACPSGTFSSVRGQQTNCTACAAGTYTNTVGNSKCSKCDDLTYQNSSGMSSCLDCPANTRRFYLEKTVQVGLNKTVSVSEEQPGISIEECFCLEGYWLPEAVDDSIDAGAHRRALGPTESSSASNCNDGHRRALGPPGPSSASNASNCTAKTKQMIGGLECKACPTGGTCEGFDGRIQQPPKSAAGFWGIPSQPSKFYECGLNACKANFECEKGRHHRLCTEHDVGYFSVGTIPNAWFLECGDKTISVLFSLAGMTIVICIHHVVNNLANSNYDAFASVMVLLQMTGLVTRFQLRWHPNLTYLNLFISIMNFEMDFFGPQCILTKWGAADVYFVQLFVPGMIWVGVFIEWHLHKLLHSHSKKHEENLLEKPLLNKVVFRWATYVSKDPYSHATTTTFKFTNIMYTTLALRAFSPYMCTPEPDGKHSFMTLTPEITCGAPMHIVMMVVSAIYIPVVVVGWPLYCARALYKAYKTEALHSAEFLEKWSWIFSKYSMEYFWWEIVVLSRRLILVLIVCFVSVPMLQAALAIILLCSMLTLQLSAMPFTNDGVDWLETFGLCCCMAYAVSGLLFYPSLDNQIHCVGSALDSADCHTNDNVKYAASIIIVVLVIVTILASLWITYKEFENMAMAQQAARRIEFDKQWYGKDKTDKGSRRGSRVDLKADLKAAEPPRPQINLQLMRAASVKMLKEEEKSRSGVKYLINVLLCRHEMAELKDMDGKALDNTFADPTTLNLCDMLDGVYLNDWHKTLSLLSEKEFALQKIYGAFTDESETSQSMKQEVAYINLEQWLPRFADLEDSTSGYYSHTPFGAQLRLLCKDFPCMIDWMSTTSTENVQGFTRFIKAYVSYSANNKAIAKDVIKPEHKSAILHWLMTCTNDNRAIFSTFVQGLGVAHSEDWGEGTQEAHHVAWNLGKVATKTISRRMSLAIGGRRADAVEVIPDGEVLEAVGGKRADAVEVIPDGEVLEDLPEDLPVPLGGR